MSHFCRSAVLALVCTSMGCFDAPPEDAGDAAYVSFATTTLLGRRPLSIDEARGLEEVQAQLGRDAMLEVLMAQPEFVEHWSKVIQDDLLLWRDGGEVPNDRSCFEDRSLTSADHADLVEHLRFQSWRVPFCPEDQGTTWTSKVSKTAAPDSSEWLVDPNARDDRTREEIERDREIEGWVQAGDVDALEQQFAVEQRLAEGAPVAPAEVFLSSPPGDGLMVDDVAPDGVGALEPVFGKGGCDERFTLADVLDASLAEDRMDALLRTAIGPQATYTAGASDVRNARDFLMSYTNRDMACVSCHSAQFSTTNPTPRNGHWDRFVPSTPIALETGAFSYYANGTWYDGALGGDAAEQRVVSLFREDQWTADGGLHPFGMHPSCSTFAANGIARTGYVDPESLSALVDENQASLAGLTGSRAGVLELMDHFAVAVHTLDWDDLEGTPNPLYGDWVHPDDVWDSGDFNAACGGCHVGGDNPTSGPLLTTNATTMSPSRIHEIVSNGPLTGGTMLAYGTYTANQALGYMVDAGMLEHPMQYRRVAHPDRPADEVDPGLAHLVAMRFVDNVFEEVTGSRLTTDTGFPRNPEASQTLNVLTRKFVDEGWSLRALLKEMLLSSHANRLAPSASALEAYPLPMVVEPFADVNESDDTYVLVEGDDANGPGDLVHRWSVHSLMSQVHHALEWPEARFFPSPNDGAYGDDGFLLDVGAQLSRSQLGFQEHSMKAALAWEDEVGTCARPTGAPDFIDRVTHEDLGYTLEEAMLAVKERLVTAPVWWGGDLGDGPVLVGNDGATNEYGLTEDLAGVSLTVPAHYHPGVVRDYCAALLNSPQFLLSGLPAEVPPDADSLVPCERGEACTWVDHCEGFAATADVLGLGRMKCEDDPYIPPVTWGSR